MMRSLLWCTLILAAAIWSPLLVRAQAPVRNEWIVKANYLKNFGQFTTWPPDADPNTPGKLLIGLLGPDPTGGYFDALKDKKVGNRVVEIHRFASVKDYRPCHIVYISPLNSPDANEASPDQRLAALMPVRNKNVLIVSDAVSKAAAAGAMINFRINAQGFVILEISRRNLRDAALNMDAQVLNLNIVTLVP